MIQDFLEHDNLDPVSKHVFVIPVFGLLVVHHVAYMLIRHISKELVEPQVSCRDFRASPLSSSDAGCVPARKGGRQVLVSLETLGGSSYLPWSGTVRWTAADLSRRSTGTYFYIQTRKP